MSLKNAELHAIAALSAAAITAGLGVGMHAFAGGESAPAAEPPLADLEAIEASIATRKRPARLPQKRTQAPPPPVEADRVSREATRLPDPPPERPPPPRDPQIDLDDPLRSVRRRELPDDGSPVGPERESAGDFNDSERGFAEETKGHPFFRGVARDISEAWAVPTVMSSTVPAVGCLHITAAGKIAKTKLEGSGDGPFDQTVEQALKKVETLRNKSPEPVPTDVLQLATTRWICFKFSPQSRSE
jgi:hypothetical protein